MTYEEFAKLFSGNIVSYPQIVEKRANLGKIELEQQKSVMKERLSERNNIAKKTL